MHLAMPPRKTSRPPPYARNQQSPGVRIPQVLRNILRRDRLRIVAGGILAILGLLWVFGLIGGGGSRSGSAAAALIGTGPPVVIVTVFDPQAELGWVEKIKKNRDQYAKKHGYLTFYPSSNDYPLRNAPASWAKVPALRHAMTLHPTSLFFWYLDSTSLIANPSMPIHTNLLTPAKLEKLMIVGEPVVPPDSVIRTFGNLKGDRIDIALTQDKEGLSVNSFVVRNGEWAKYFLDAWFDPIYRSYNFQKAEAHALEHVVQWHGTILAKLALLPQNTFNAYKTGNANPKNGQYTNGDFVAGFSGCDKDKRNCADEMKDMFEAIEKAS